jgi:hypothetical protein
MADPKDLADAVDAFVQLEEAEKACMPIVRSAQGDVETSSPALERVESNLERMAEASVDAVKDALAKDGE